ncbi:MAG: ATP-binding cassette domain-containing protein [Clostridiales bacterium]|nr:ATP-binding cassette domain-containing protein [Clostridiales bacterium]
MKAISVRNLSKSFGDRIVLNNFSCDFPFEETTCVMGESGCGKTTLLRILMGLEKADAGKIEIPDGQRMTAVFQEDRLINHFSALGNCRLVSSKKKDDENRKLLLDLGLSGSMDIQVKKLSGGMARRVAIARCLSSEGDIYIMDEPFKGLDSVTKRQVMDVIKRKTSGKTLIIVTHDRDEAEYMGGKVLNLNPAALDI